MDDNDILTAELYLELKEAQEKINKAIEYLERMSFQSVVDNPKKDLLKILKKEKNDEI